MGFSKPAMLAAALLALSCARAQAAGGAYVVDDSDVEEPGSCKLETWASFASNSDRIFVASPACVVNLFKPIELGAQLARSRFGGVWGTDLDLKAKVNFIPSEKNPFGIGLMANASFDLIANQFTAVSLVVPVTFAVGEKLRLNLNGGWLYDRTIPQHVAVWGAGFEWIVLKNSVTVTLIGEVFGQSVGTPGTQAGLRLTPHEKFDIDFILGRNLTGEHATWFTAGVNLRF